MNTADKYLELKNRFDLLDEADLCALLGVEPETLAKHRVAGTGPTPIRAMRAVFYASDDVKMWLLRQRDGERGRTGKNNSAGRT